MDDLLALAKLFNLNLTGALKFNYSEEDAQNNSDVGNVSEESSRYEEDLFKYYLMGIGGMILCCLGIIGNILSVIILTRRVMRSSTYSYLTALALSDTFFLFLTMLILIKDAKKPQKILTFDDPWYVYMFPYVHPSAVTFQVTSIWLTLAFTVDRYIMICHPFKAEGMCTISRARKVICALFIAGILYNIPRFFEYHVSYHDIPNSVSSNTTFTKVFIEISQFGKTALFREIVHSWLYITCVAGIPFLALLVLNTFLIIAVHNSRKKGKQINAKEKHRNNTTVMLISVVVIFLLCQGPALISRMIWAFDYNKAFRRSWNTFNEISNFLVIVNSAINIVPYYFFGRKFRRQFWRLFCRCLLTKEELRKLARSLSISVDQRKLSNTKANAQELAHFQNMYNRNNKKWKNSIAVPLINSTDQRLSVGDTVGHSEKNPASTEHEHRKLTVNFEANGNCESRVDDIISCVNCHNNSIL